MAAFPDPRVGLVGRKRTPWAATRHPLGRGKQTLRWGGWSAGLNMWSGPLAEDREPTQRQGPERRRAAPAAGGRAGLVSAAFAVEACERGRASEGG